MDNKKQHNTPFKVPEHYFDQLQNKLMDVKNERRGAPLRWVWASLAAAAILVAVFVFFKPPSAAEYTEDPVIAYLIQEDISEEEILEVMIEEFVDETKGATIIETVDIDDIEDYLLEEDLELEDLIEI